MTNPTTARDVFLASKIYQDLEDNNNKVFGIPGGDQNRFVVKRIFI